jgi:hypothetical protein
MFCLDVAVVCRCVSSTSVFFWVVLPGLNCEHIFYENIRVFFGYVG